MTHKTRSTLVFAWLLVGAALATTMDKPVMRTEPEEAIFEPAGEVSAEAQNGDKASTMGMPKDSVEMSIGTAGLTQHVPIRPHASLLTPKAGETNTEETAQVTVADESLEANRVRKLYGSVRNALTFEGTKSLKHHTSSKKWASDFMTMFTPSNSGSLLEGIKYMTGLSKMQTKIVGVFEIMVDTEKKCMAASNALLSGPGDDLLQTAETSQLAQYLARDAELLAQFAEVEATSALTDFAAWDEFVKAAEASVCSDLCKWLLNAALESHGDDFFIEAAKGFQSVRDKSTSLKEQLQGNPVLEEHVQQMQDILMELDATENAYFTFIANTCKKAHQSISPLPSRFVSETLSILQECITENEGEALDALPQT